MKYILIFLLGLFACSNSYAQQIESVKIFDIKLFKDNQVGNKYQFTQEDTLVVVQEDTGKFYEETITNKGTTKIRRKIYLKDGKLYGSGSSFCGVHIGISRQYNEYGDLLKELDNDAPYKFSMDELRKLLKQELKIDILYPNRRVSIDRNEFRAGKFLGNHKWEAIQDPYYTIVIRGERKGDIDHIMEIDGTTGEILSHIDENGKELISKDKKDTCMNDNDKRSWTPLID